MVRMRTSALTTPRNHQTRNQNQRQRHRPDSSGGHEDAIALHFNRAQGRAPNRRDPWERLLASCRLGWRHDQCIPHESRQVVSVTRKYCLMRYPHQ